MNYLENSRIRLRALEPSDVDLLYLWENDTDLWHVSDTLSPFSRDILVQYIESVHKDIFEQKQLRLVVEVRDNGTSHPIGLIDLFDIDFLHQRAAVGILIYAAEDRKKGFASEALEILTKYCFEVLTLHQLYCYIPDDNAASIALFTNAGFEHNGTLKEWRKTAAGWRNILLMQRIYKKE